VRKLFGWIAGLVGIAALARWLSTRRARSEAPPPLAAPEEDPSEALRQKLSESRAEPAATPREQPAETPEPPEQSETLDERRARVHAKAQEAIDAMQDPPT
jgi:hypothetical protein